MRCVKLSNFPGFCLTWIVGYDMKKSFLDNFRRINCLFDGIFTEKKDCFSIFCQNLKIDTWHPQHPFSALAPISPRGLPTHFVVDGHKYGQLPSRESILSKHKQCLRSLFNMVLSRGLKWLFLYNFWRFNAGMFVFYTERSSSPMVQAVQCISSGCAAEH